MLRIIINNIVKSIIKQYKGLMFLSDSFISVFPSVGENVDADVEFITSSDISVELH